jgi:ABC-type phosphate transport system substrate-binding protein
MKHIRHQLAIVAAAFSLALLAAPAQAELVVVVGAKSPAASMTSEQVAQVFLGKSTSMTPVDQPESEAIRGEFYKKVAGKDAAQAKALWSKLVFTGKASLPKELAGSAEVKKAVAADPKAIGYIDKSALDGSVKAVLSVP